jgi:topoisomerase IV subunit B
VRARAAPASLVRGIVSAVPSIPESSTHDWSNTVDRQHLRGIADDVVKYAPTGVLHLLAEVLAYADDEAAETRVRRCVVTLRPGGVVCVADFGRGTDTRRDPGAALKKPVMSSQDLRFFDTDPPALLPDGYPRRGMSVVAALSSRLVHVNRRANGSWRQVYEGGIPVTDLVALPGDGTTGTTVEFTPLSTLASLPDSTTDLLPQLTAWVHLDVEVVDERGGT